MVRRDGAATRKERMHEIARQIHRLLANHSKIALSKTVVALQYEYGLTKQKILEYLEIMEGSDYFILNKELDTIKKIEGES